MASYMAKGNNEKEINILNTSKAAIIKLSKASASASASAGVSGSNIEHKELQPEKYLDVKPFHLLQNVKEHKETLVPVESAISRLFFDSFFASMPKSITDISEDEIPYVRDVGIKKTIETFGNYLNLTEYEFDLVQFWFLDVLVDCLWRAQDEYRFPKKFQKIVLEWFLFIFDLIHSVELHFSRREFFEIFHQAISLAEEHVESGCEILPPPEEIFKIKPISNSKEKLEVIDLQEVKRCPSTPSPDTTPTSYSIEDEDESFILIDSEDNQDFFKLPKRSCFCKECADNSSIDTLSEKSIAIRRSGDDLEIEKSTEIKDGGVQETTSMEELCLGDSEDFLLYRAKSETPPRFLSLQELQERFTPEVLHVCESDKESDNDYQWVEAEESQFTGHENQNESKNLPEVEAAGESSQVPVKQWQKVLEEKLKKEEIKKKFIDHELSQFRNMAADDSNEGLLPPDQTFQGSGDVAYLPPSEEVKTKCLGYLSENRKFIKKFEENKFVNYCVLVAIKQCVFENFYDSFQFKLIKLITKSPYNVITQKVNTEWFTPKVFKEVFKKPATKKPKKEKAKKKKDKSSKTGSQKSKKSKSKSSKSSKKSSKSSKTSKKTKSKKDKDKKKKLTKEEKAELERLKREQELQEQELFKQYENRHFVFPLSEAVTDEFFESIFEDWVKPKIKEGKKGRKEKKGKSGSRASSKK